MDMIAAFGLAFVFGGVLAAVFQAAAMLTKAKPPTLLTVGFAIGGVLVPTGLIMWAEMAGGGMTAMVVDAGAALGGNILALFMTGMIAPLLIVLATFVALVLIGCLTGAISKPQGLEDR